MRGRDGGGEEEEAKGGLLTETKSSLSHLSSAPAHIYLVEDERDDEGRMSSRMYRRQSAVRACACDYNHAHKTRTTEKRRLYCFAGCYDVERRRKTFFFPFSLPSFLPASFLPSFRTSGRNRINADAEINNFSSFKKVRLGRGGVRLGRSNFFSSRPLR